ncbi:hypothetical protein D9M69_597620 [compost metagenome]
MLALLPPLVPRSPDRLSDSRQLHHPRPLAIPRNVRTVDHHEVSQQLLLGNPESPPRPLRVSAVQGGALWRFALRRRGAGKRRGGNIIRRRGELPPNHLQAARRMQVAPILAHAATSNTGNTATPPTSRAAASAFVRPGLPSTSGSSSPQITSRAAGNASATALATGSRLPESTAITTGQPVASWMLAAVA